MASEMMQMYKFTRGVIEDCFNNPLHDSDPKSKTYFSCFKSCTGPGVPGYFDPERCQILFVGLAPTLPEVTTTARIRAPFVDAYGQRFANVLKGTPMFGDSRIGFTTAIKCAIKSKQGIKGIFGNCKTMLEDEFGLVRPSVIVLVGEQVARLICPEIVGTANWEWGLCGTFYTAIDRTYYFMRDPETYLDKNGKAKESEDTYFTHLLSHQLQELASYLVPHDKWLGRTHKDRLSKGDS